MPDDLGAAITRSVALLGEHAAYAVRSSATTEDLPDGLLRRPAGHLPQRGGISGHPPGT